MPPKLWSGKGMVQVCTSLVVTEKRVESMNNLHNPNETYEIAVRKVTQAPYDKEDLVALHTRYRFCTRKSDEQRTSIRHAFVCSTIAFTLSGLSGCAAQIERPRPIILGQGASSLDGSRHCLPAKFSGCSPSWVEAKSHLVVQALQVYSWGPACFAHFLLFFWNEIPKWRQPSPRESTYNLCWDFSAQGSHLTRPWLPASATGDPPVPNNPPTASELQRGRGMQEWETWLVVSFGGLRGNFAEKFVGSREILTFAAHGMSTGYSVGKFVGDRRA